MAELPLNVGACGWVGRTVRRELSDAEKELVTILCAGLRVGPWNVSGDWRLLRPYGNGARMAVREGLSTADFDELTRLVFAAHDRSCRITINPRAGPRMIEVCCWKRTRDADISLGHPTLEQAVKVWRERTDALVALPDVGTTAPEVFRG